jgi:hypothetical protein
MNQPATITGTRLFGHNCTERNECWVERHLTRFDWFNHCFPNRMGFMDIDGTIEINGYYLLVEFKAHRDALTTGQRLYLEHEDDNHCCLVAVVPDWRVKRVTEVAFVVRGKLGAWRPCTLEQLCEFFEWWVARAYALPTAHGVRRLG